MQNEHCVPSQSPQLANSAAEKLRNASSRPLKEVIKVKFSNPFRAFRLL